MKPLLSLLMMFVLMDVQAKAHSGGPDFGGINTGLTTGTFAGVLIPTSDTSVTATTTTDENSLGVFSIGIPDVSLASGVFAYFSNGKTYTGTILGEADPEKLTLQALVDAQFNLTKVIIAGGVPRVVTTPGGFASGSIKARVKSAQGGFLSSGGLIRITGTATLDVQGANVGSSQPTGAISRLTLDVDGYKQSNTTAATVDITSITNTQATSSATTGGSSTPTGP